MLWKQNRKLSTQNRLISKCILQQWKLKPFSEERKLREFIASRPELKEMLKKVHKGKKNDSRGDPGMPRKKERKKERTKNNRHGNIWVNRIILFTVYIC